VAVGEAAVAARLIQSALQRGNAGRFQTADLIGIKLIASVIRAPQQKRNTRNN